MPQADFQPTWALIKKPDGYPTGPAIGKPEMIWRTNEHSLYHRLSPYSNYNKGRLTWGDEPFYFIYPDESGTYPNSAMKYESTLFPIGSGPIDVIRVSKFLVSGRGLGFLAKQFLLQTGNPYNETRIYNPTSPIVAAGLALTLGTARPMRMFDTSAGLAGIATSLLGSAGGAIGSVFGDPKTNPVAGTALANNNPGALPSVMLTTGTKGLLRAGDASRAKSHLEAAWQGSSNNGFSITGLVTSLFQNFIPQTQPGIQYRSDEGAYGLMIGAGSFRFRYNSHRGLPMDFNQLFIGGGKVTRPGGDYPAYASRIFVNPDGTPNIIKVLDLEKQPLIPTVGRVGYSVDESTDSNSPGYKYGDNLGVVDAPFNEDFQGSDVMIQYGMYATEGNNYPTKDPGAQHASNTKTQLQAVLDKIAAAGDGKIYTVEADDNSVLLQQDSVRYNYDRLFRTKNNGDSPKRMALGALRAYRDRGVTMVTNDMVDDVQRSLKLPTNGQFDAINTLNVLDGTRSTSPSPLSGRWSTWEPYKDDLIALYFYDVVNDKYIPFRASIKGLVETGNASWDEMPFIGRADKIYSYGGFNRNAAFNIKIVISSIAELSPTWQRINYMATAIKPANYTKSTYGNLSIPPVWQGVDYLSPINMVANSKPANAGITDRFMVPPMFMLTAGDFYRDQPILIQSLTITVPEDAAWETFNEDKLGTDTWSYMAGLIRAPGVTTGQVPREVDLGFTVILLEKERAVVGGANFGHAPRTEDFSSYNTDIPNGKWPNKFNQNLVVTPKNLLVSNSSTGTSKYTQWGGNQPSQPTSEPTSFITSTPASLVPRNTPSS